MGGGPYGAEPGSLWRNADLAWKLRLELGPHGLEGRGGVFFLDVAGSIASSGKEE